MSISSLATFLLVAFGLVGARVVLFKVFKPPVEVPGLSCKTKVEQSEETLESVSMWPVVVLLSVVVTLIVALMLFGNAIGG